MKRMNMDLIKIFFLVFIACISNTFCGGFIAGTLIETIDRYIPIEAIQAGDLIYCCDTVETYNIGKVTAARSHEASQLIRLIGEDEIITCSVDQLFYLGESIGWRKAQDLQLGDQIISATGRRFIVQRIEILNGPQLVYDITVENHHNFYVSKSALLAHNVIMLAPAAPIVTSAITIATIETTAAVSCIAGFIYSLWWGTKHNKKNKHSSDFRSGGNDRCFCGHYCTGACNCECSCGCSKSRKTKDEYTYQNGIYEDAGYHHNNSKGNNKGGKSPSPKNGQKGLDKSLKIKDSSAKRVAVCDGQFIIFSKTSEGIFHGHVRAWAELEDSAKKVLIKAGLVTNSGKII